MENKEQQIFSNLNRIFEEILGDNAAEVLSSGGIALNKLPYPLSLDLVEKLLPTFKKTALDLDSSEINALSKVLIEATKIEKLYNDARRTLENVSTRIKEEGSALVTEEELLEAREDILNKKTAPQHFFSEEHKLYEIIIRHFSTNAAVRSGLFQAGKVIDVEELLAIDPRAGEHAIKSAFDQFCTSVFKRHPENYDDKTMVESVSHLHELNELGSVSLGKNETAFGYVSATPTSVPKFPRFAHILDDKDGASCAVQHIHHESKKVLVPTVVAGQKVKIMVPLWYGVVLTQKGSDMSKPLDLDTILNHSQSLAKDEPQLAKSTSKAKDYNNFISSFLEIFDTLGTADDQNYGSRVQKLKQKGS